jgi:hypothetical protein
MLKLDTKKNTFWKFICNTTIKRLNMIDLNPVNIDFFNNMICIGMIEYHKLQDILFSESDWMTMNHIWDFNNIKVNNNVFLFTVSIKQYLKQKSNNHAYHNEIWIFGLFHDDNTNKYYLSPLKRDSEFDNIDIVAKLDKLCQVDFPLPWRRHSC